MESRPDLDSGQHLAGKLLEVIAEYRYMDDHAIAAVLDRVKFLVNNWWKIPHQFEPKEQPPKES